VARLVFVQIFFLALIEEKNNLQPVQKSENGNAAMCQVFMIACFKSLTVHSYCTEG
jgi:hypothetical protein